MMRMSIRSAITKLRKQVKSADKMGGSSSTSTAPFSESAFREKIPYGKNEPERNYYERLIPVLKARKPSDRPRILIITDVEQDYDDLMAIIFLSEMHRLGVVELAGFIANHGETSRRARFLRSIVYLLGLGHLEVAQGTLAVEDTEKNARFIEDSYYELKNETFDEMPWNKKPHRQGQKPYRPAKQILNDLDKQVDPPGTPPFRSGQQLIDDLVKQVDTEGKEPLTVLLISSLQDISDYFYSHADANFLTKHFKKFISQGGYKVIESGDRCTLEPLLDMANNGYHPSAAKNYTDFLVRYNLPSDAWSREAAKAARLDGGTFARLVDHGPIGTHLSWLYKRQEFKFYWDPFNAPYMPRLNAEWYLKTRLVLPPTSELFAEFKASPPEFKKVLPHTKVIAYDGCAAIGAVGDDVMRAMGIMAAELPEYNTAAHKHRVFGRGEGDLGGIDGPQLGETFQVFFYGALRATKEFANQLIPPGTVHHQAVDLNKLTPLHVFDLQLEHLKRSKELAHEARQGNKESAKALEALEAGTLKDPKSKKEYPKVPKADDIPYELLYERAVHDRGAECR